MHSAYHYSNQRLRTLVFAVTYQCMTSSYRDNLFLLCLHDYDRRHYSPVCIVLDTISFFPVIGWKTAQATPVHKRSWSSLRKGCYMNEFDDESDCFLRKTKRHRAILARNLSETLQKRMQQIQWMGGRSGGGVIYPSGGQRRGVFYVLWSPLRNGPAARSCSPCCSAASAATRSTTTCGIRMCRYTFTCQ